MDTFVIPRPLEQQVNVGRGFYDLKLVQKKSMGLREYKQMVEKDSKQTKNKSLNQIENQVV